MAKTGVIESEGQPEAVETELIDEPQELEEETPEETEEVEEEVKAEPEPEETVLEIEGEQPEEEETQKAPEWVKEVRRQNRELEKQNRELQKALKDKEEATKTRVLPDKPTLESCDFDAEEFEKQLDTWKEQKREIESQAKNQEAEQRKAIEAYNKRLEEYQARKSASKLKGFDEAEEFVKHKFTPIQQSIIVKHAKAPENVVYVLGTNEKRAQELMSIADPIEFALSIRELEGKITVKQKTQTKPQPERQVSGNSGTQVVSKTIDELEKEAERTGDRSKIIAYHREERKRKASN